MTRTITRKGARQLDLERYFTGKPCGRGHLSERFTGSGVCIECNDENNERRWKKPKDPVKLMAKEACMDRGGPTSREEAMHHGIEWFLHPDNGRCGHGGILNVKTWRCQLCGISGPRVSNEALDLLS